MSTDRSFEAAVHEAMADTGVSPVLITDEVTLDLGALEYGVVNLFAPWSGPCFVCLKIIAAMRLPTPKPWLYVVDVGRMSAGWLERNFHMVPHGRGETFWVRGGEVIAKDEAFSMRPADIAKHTARLFRPG